MTEAQARQLAREVNRTIGGNLSAKTLMRPHPVAVRPDRVAAEAVPKAKCGPHDKPETALQGQVPQADRVSGRAAEGYSCNLKLIAQAPDVSFANFDSYRNCVYYSNNPGGSEAEGVTVVMDLSDPAHPVKTDELTARAMRNAGESLRVNQARGLLVADHYNYVGGEDSETARSLGVYDLTKDCRHPVLLADVIMPTAEGHEGCFQPDGMVYYMASLGPITPIDLSDPRHPKQLSEPWEYSTHGCSVSDDGTRLYMAQWGSGMVTIDSTDVQARKPGAEPKELSLFETPDNIGQQGTIPLMYGSRRVVFDWSEAAGTGFRVNCADPNLTSNFGYGQMIDVTDDQQPKRISRLQLEVHLPEHCAETAGDYTQHTRGIEQGDTLWTVYSNVFAYDFHYCRTDRLHDPTVLACANFISGLRVFDIRDPAKPKEIAYYNTGTLSASTTETDFATSPPVIRRDLGQIWWVTMFKGLHAAQFEDGVWPFKDADPCPGSYDYYADQYDPTYRECLARKGQTPAPSPGALISLPSAKRCRANRKLAVRLGQPTTGRLKRVKVYVNGKRVRDLRGRRIRSAITLRTPRRGRFTVRVVATPSAGRAVTVSRRYRAC